MKNLGFASALALSLLSLAVPQGAAAQSAAGGTYWFILDDELEKTVTFEARTDGKGTTTGQLTLTDAALVPDFEEEETPSRDGAPLTVKASLNSMTVEKNRALMSGVVLDSSHRSYIGRWVQLVVEDNGRERPDQLVWKFCKPQEKGWVPTDADREKDDGAYLRWWATDAERKDDVGIPSVNLLPAEDMGCTVYPLAVYAFAELLKWEGDIFVEP